uniref:NADH dehydrogenase subunit 2 n=2 Tax=Salix suchowensis TaxID=1278906 RepID=A0A109WZG7_9ROSI|nr:NADH dehydrogenase subunit 2 [Salix suchowensis]YP_010203754.1 NADH dehydrogenase subunit 2 [Salix brachista]YP_010203777.1 NADH dehydrogenase subunit 2 [Salix dunnii]YP_010417387.1 NADH dehydrogenase subunit 2 [Salix wilsonii]YP_010571493.1 NADH dehydrogenase subunit 2 [Salix koriyanagi]YP_010571544.1 NADH dehydrogenase subunit 2 [Salix integra]YP_010593394.1 NADH dehydrogenase subunit 2 [Salix triandra]UPN63843.1 NADH dehydrogenase subunit 2 [Salix arbutifolia]UZG92002.1 NADH dehydroge
MFNLFLAVSPEIFIINATSILLIHGVVFSTSKKYDYPPLVSNVGWLGLLSVLITLLLLAAGAPLLTIAHLFWNNFFRRDNFTYFCQILLLLSTAGTISMCFDSSEQERFDAFEFIVLILLPTRSMLFMISAHDSIAMYLAIEPQSLCFYVIAASKRKSEFSTEAGSKYLILGAFPSGILLFGCSMIYGSTGATHFDQLAKILTGYEGARSSGIFMGILSIAVGFLFKITAVPFHMWAPDIYEGSPTPVTAFLSIAPKISISANISRVSIYGSYGATLQQIFFFCSIASMILGALAAMAQTKVKRPLAHSSIGHVGYIRTGFSCGTIEGIQSLLIGIFIYALMTIDAFAIVSALRQTRVKYIADLGALAKTNPISAITFSITMFSYAGIPPLAGFCSKFYLFFAALGCGAYFLAPVGVVTSVIGRFYYIRLAKRMFFDTPRTWILYEPMDRNKSLLLAMTSSFITSSFLYPSPLFSVTHQMALSSYL